MTTVADEAPLYITQQAYVNQPYRTGAAGSCRPHCPESRFITKDFPNHYSCPGSYYQHYAQTGGAKRPFPNQAEEGVKRRENCADQPL